MRLHVREVEAPAETRGLEELIAEASPGEDRPAEWPIGEPAAGPTADGHALTARDLGPNGDVVLDTAVAAIVRGRSGARSRAILIACIGNAGLAVLVRDCIDQETFDVLFGPWREIMHH
jgi:hypothetical protein